MTSSAQAMLIDDPKSLKLMFKDMADAYEVDDYWKNIEYRNKLISLYNLHNFRRGGFGSYDATPNRPKITLKFSLLRKAIFKMVSVERLLAARGYKLPFSLQRDDVGLLRNWYGETIFSILHVKDKRLWEISDSGLGNPEDKIEIGGKTYTHKFLIFFHRFTVMNDLFPFENVKYFLEIGGSYGGQIEVLLKLYPYMKACLIEIPPQLYVAQQYLSAVFPGKVMKYDEVRKLDFVSRETFCDRNIIMIAPWQIEKLAEHTFEAFTNQYSFQEMSRKTVENYCKQIQRLVTSFVFLFEHRYGHPSVKDPVGKNEYMHYLSPRFKLYRSIEENFHETILGSRKLCLNNDIYCFKSVRMDSEKSLL